MTFLGLVGGSVEHPALDFSSGHDLMTVRSSPTSGSTLGVRSAWDSLSPSVPPLLVYACACTCALFLSLSQKKKKKKGPSFKTEELWQSEEMRAKLLHEHLASNSCHIFKKLCHTQNATHLYLSISVYLTSFTNSALGAHGWLSWLSGQLQLK